MTAPAPEHLCDAEVDVPARALTVAGKAVAAGWAVRITTVRGPAIGADGEPVREFRLEADTREESTGKARRVYGDVKIVDVVALRARRGSDYVLMIWTDGKFSSASRPRAMRVLASASALAHLEHSAELECRWLPTSRGREVCDHHGEVREAA